jgi:hypothetical protein
LHQFDGQARITFPNVDGLPAGSRALIYSFDHDLGRWILVGGATVSADGMRLEPDNDAALVAPGWHFTGLSVCFYYCVRNIYLLFVFFFLFFVHSFVLSAHNSSCAPQVFGDFELSPIGAAALVAGIAVALFLTPFMAPVLSFMFTAALWYDVFDRAQSAYKCGVNLGLGGDVDYSPCLDVIKAKDAIKCYNSWQSGDVDLLKCAEAVLRVVTPAASKIFKQELKIADEWRHLRHTEIADAFRTRHGYGYILSFEQALAAEKRFRQLQAVAKLGEAVKTIRLTARLYNAGQDALLQNEINRAKQNGLAGAVLKEQRIAVNQLVMEAQAAQADKRDAARNKIVQRELASATYDVARTYSAVTNMVAETMVRRLTYVSMLRTVHNVGGINVDAETPASYTERLRVATQLAPNGRNATTDSLALTAIAAGPLLSVNATAAALRSLVPPTLAAQSSFVANYTLARCAAVIVHFVYLCFIFFVCFCVCACMCVFVHVCACWFCVCVCVCVRVLRFCVCACVCMRDLAFFVTLINCCTARQVVARRWSTGTVGRHKSIRASRLLSLVSDSLYAFRQWRSADRPLPTRHSQSCDVAIVLRVAVAARVFCQ